MIPVWFQQPKHWLADLPVMQASSLIHNVHGESMSRIRIKFIVILTILLFSSTTAFADKNPGTAKQRIGGGNPVAGKDKSALCQSCHGEDGNSPTVEVPKLAGQYAAYIVKQMQDYQTGKRADAVMTGMAATVTEKQDLLDIAAYFASQRPMKHAGPVIAIQKAGEDKYLGMGCVRCHVLDGKSGTGDFLAPRVGGQHKAYLIKSLRSFKDGTRTNDPSSVMNKLVIFMSDQDLVNVSNFVAGM